MDINTINMNCCVNDLGSFPHNSDIDTGLVAAVTGNYKIKLEYSGSILTKTVALLSGDEIIIERPFNENYLFKFTIEDPNGDLVESDGCTNFMLKTYVNVNSTCNPICDTDEDTEEQPYVYDEGSGEDVGGGGEIIVPPPPIEPEPPAPPL